MKKMFMQSNFARITDPDERVKMEGIMDAVQQICQANNPKVEVERSDASSHKILLKTDPKPPLPVNRIVRVINEKYGPEWKWWVNVTSGHEEIWFDFPRGGNGFQAYRRSNGNTRTQNHTSKYGKMKTRHLRKMCDKMSLREVVPHVLNLKTDLQDKVFPGSKQGMKKYNFSAGWRATKDGTHISISVNDTCGDVCIYPVMTDILRSRQEKLSGRPDIGYNVIELYVSPYLRKNTVDIIIKQRTAKQVVAPLTSLIPKVTGHSVHIAGKSRGQRHSAFDQGFMGGMDFGRFN